MGPTLLSLLIVSLPVPAGPAAMTLIAPRSLQPAIVDASSVSAATIELWREADGLFYVTGEVNGEAVRFLVDTGASMIVLSADDARRAGVLPAAEAFVHKAETAGGASVMARVRLGQMSIGATRAAEVPAAVARAGLQVSLLGQNWLSHIASVTIEGDRMILR